MDALDDMTHKKTCSKRQRIRRRRTLSGTPTCGAARLRQGALRMTSIIRLMTPWTFSDGMSPSATSCAGSCSTGSPAFTVPGAVLTLLHRLLLAATAEPVGGAAGARRIVAAAAPAAAAQNVRRNPTILLVAGPALLACAISTGGGAIKHANGTVACGLGPSSSCRSAFLPSGASALRFQIRWGSISVTPSVRAPHGSVTRTKPPHNPINTAPPPRPN